MFTISFSYATMITLALFGLLLFMLLVIVLGNVLLKTNKFINMRDYRPSKTQPAQAEPDYHPQLGQSNQRELTVSDVVEGEWIEIGR